jgi:DNA-binding NtrC family response regulator
MAGVLIVEDEIFVALDIEHILITAGFDVAGIAQDRMSAMALAGDCDVALIDLNLHDGATGPSIGMDLAAQHGVKIVFVTSHPFAIGDATDVAADVVTKPFRPDVVIDVVRRALDNGKSDRAKRDGNTAILSPRLSFADHGSQS